MHDHDEDYGSLGMIGSVPICATCGSERVARDAWACWNSEYGLWELETVFDQEFCHHCEGETHFQWKWVDGPPRAAIRDLNDELRVHGRGNGSVLATAGLQARGDDFLRKAVQAVRSFDAFTADNDPYGEHDFGAAVVEGERVFWKIDAYDRSMTHHSPNPANPGVTHRVLTIMLAEEY